jgi:hypothetical protein
MEVEPEAPQCICGNYLAPGEIICPDCKDSTGLKKNSEPKEIHQVRATRAPAVDYYYSYKFDISSFVKKAISNQERKESKTKKPKTVLERMLAHNRRNKAERYARFDERLYEG